MPTTQLLLCGISLMLWKLMIVDFLNILLRNPIVVTRRYLLIWMLVSNAVYALERAEKYKLTMLSDLPVVGLKLTLFLI